MYIIGNYRDFYYKGFCPKSTHLFVKRLAIRSGNFMGVPLLYHHNNKIFLKKYYATIRSLRSAVWSESLKTGETLIGLQLALGKFWYNFTRWSCLITLQDLHSAQETFHNTQNTVYISYCTVHSSQYTVHSTQITVHRSQYTMALNCFIVSRATSILLK